MIKAPIDLQDLRRRIYAEAKAELSWRFWAKARPRLGFGWKRWSSRGGAGNWGSTVSTGSNGRLRGKRLQHDESHNPWCEVSRGA
jgi:hypothetical protein